MKQWTCTDCGTPVARRAKRCKPCRYLAQRTVDRDAFRRLAHLPNADLVAHFGVNVSCICEVRKELGLPAPKSIWRHGDNPTRQPKPLPEGFTDDAARMTIAHLCRKYERSRAVIEGWLKRAEITPVRAVTITRSKSFGERAAGGWTKMHDNRDCSRAGMAAKFLGRLGPIYRCDARGKPLPDGFFWNRGGFVLSDDEVIERAERNGWREHEWRDLAA